MYTRIKNVLPKEIFLHFPDHWPQTNVWLHPSIPPSQLPLILSSIHPPTQLLGTICYFLLFIHLCFLFPLPKSIHDVNSLLSDIVRERDNLGRTLYISSSLASQLRTPHACDNQNDCHVRNYPEKYPFDIQTENTPARHVMQLWPWCLCAAGMEALWCRKGQFSD